MQNSNTYYWMWGGESVPKYASDVMLLTIETVNRWLSARFNLLSSAVVGCTGFIAVLSPNITAAQAGFALAFAWTVTGDVSIYLSFHHVSADISDVLVVVLGMFLCGTS